MPEVAMADESQLKILKQKGCGWNEWRRQVGVHLVDLSAADLSRVNLTGANLHGATLALFPPPPAELPRVT